MHGYFEQERNGTGGVLFLMVSFLLGICLVLSISFVRQSTSRSVAETVQSTIAMQCLASCYINKAEYGSSGTWTDPSKEFKSTSRTYTTTIKPLEQFNQTMKKYRLMRSNERTGRSSGEAKEVYLQWKRYDPDQGYRSTFYFEVGEYVCYDSWWDHILKIHPSPQKVSTESSYTINS